MPGILLMCVCEGVDVCVRVEYHVWVCLPVMLCVCFVFMLILCLYVCSDSEPKKLSLGFPRTDNKV